MTNVLVISSTDGIRSQMVRAYLQYYARKRANIYSAGLKLTKINPIAIQVMKEDGIDMSHQTVNLLQDYDHINFDYIVTVDNAVNENLPYLPSSARKVHIDLEDLSLLKGTNEELLEKFRDLKEKVQIFAHKFSKVHFKGLRP